MQSVHGSGFFGDAWDMVRFEYAKRKGIERKDGNLHDGGTPCTFVHVTNRATQLVGHDHQHQRRGNQLRDSARGRQNTGGVAHVVAIANHHGQRNQSHGNHLTGHSASDRTQDEADDDDGISKAAFDGAK